MVNNTYYRIYSYIPGVKGIACSTKVYKRKRNAELVAEREYGKSGETFVWKVDVTNPFKQEEV